MLRACFKVSGYVSESAIIAPVDLEVFSFKFLVGPTPHPQPMASQAHHQSVAQLIAPALRAVVSPLLGGNAERVAIRSGRELHRVASQRMHFGWSEGHRCGPVEAVHPGVLCVARLPWLALVGPGGAWRGINSVGACMKVRFWTVPAPMIPGLSEGACSKKDFLPNEPKSSQMHAPKYFATIFHRMKNSSNTSDGPFSPLVSRGGRGTFAQVCWRRFFFP